jgi:hypothetical protein
MTERNLRTRVEGGLTSLLGERRAVTLLGRIRIALGSFRRTPLRARDPWRQPFFCIIGAGRSGTTLLRAMLCRHPEVCVPPEMEAVGTLAQDYLRINALPWDALSRLCMSRVVAHPDFANWKLDGEDLLVRAARLPAAQRGLDQLLGTVYTAYRDTHRPGARLIGDKTPLNTMYLDWLDAIVPDARHIHLVRDGRAVVESFVRHWGDLNDRQSLLKGCRIWRERVRRAHRFCRSRPPGRAVEIRYEDLVEDPEAVLRGLAELLDLDFRSEMLEHRDTSLDLGDTAAPHMATLAKPLMQDLNQRWRQLPEDDQLLITRTLEDDLRSFGYLSGARD